jgi:3-isopropylmalate/(R)-2-methylmalate dehydratase small subunit
MEKIRGKAWKFENNVDTDQVMPSQYLLLPTIKEMSEHTFEPIKPDFSQNVKQGDVIVAGKNFGCGSSREQAPAVLKELGIKAIIAKSFARIFYRNSINIGLPALSCAVADDSKEGDVLSVDLERGTIVNETTKKEFLFEPLPDFILAVIKDGGIIKHTRKQKK